MTEKKHSELVLDTGDIKRLLPHRAPFLFIERLTNIVPNVSATGFKAVGYNEPFFAGHFPDHPVMPGVLIVEAMAQAGAVMAMQTTRFDPAEQIIYFMAL